MPKLKTGIVLIEFTPIASAAAAKTYYKVRRADYYIDSDDVSATWGGKGCARLKLVGPVTPKEFNRLTDNLHPTAKGSQPLTAKMCCNRKVGTDITFHVPKALSLLAELVGEKVIETEAAQCVDEVMAEIEKDAATRVRR